ERVDDRQATATVRAVLDVSVCGMASRQVIHRRHLDRHVAVLPVGSQGDEVAPVVHHAVGDELGGDDEDICRRVLSVDTNLVEPCPERGAGRGELCGVGRKPSLEGRHGRTSRESRKSVMFKIRSTWRGTLHSTSPDPVALSARDASAIALRPVESMKVIRARSTSTRALCFWGGPGIASRKRLALLASSSPVTATHGRSGPRASTVIAWSSMTMTNP